MSLFQRCPLREVPLHTHTYLNITSCTIWIFLATTLDLPHTPLTHSHSWLLHDPNMKLRSTYPPYLQAVKRYFTRLFEILVPLQSAYGGPIIAFQVENEFSHYTGTSRADGKEYLRFLYQVRQSVCYTTLYDILIICCGLL